MQRLAGRVALITGSSRGIGAAVARRFAAEGAQTVLVARSEADLEKVDDDIRLLAGNSACLIPLDLCEFELISRLEGALAQRFGRLDILVANAATLGSLGPVSSGDPKQWQQVLEVNLLANYHLIRAVDHLLRSSDAGRAIFVTCSQTNTAFWSAYNASKIALESMVKAYATEVGYSKVRVNLLEPRAVRTSLRSQAFPNEDPTTLATPEDVTEEFVELAQASCTLHSYHIRAQRRDSPI